MTDPSICASCAYWIGDLSDVPCPPDADYSATCPAWVCASLPDLDDDAPEGCHGVRCDDCDDPECPENPENGAGMP